MKYIEICIYVYIYIISIVISIYGNIMKYNEIYEKMKKQYEQMLRID